MMSTADSGPPAARLHLHSFDEFVEAKIAGLQRFALGLVGGNQDDAWDLTQDALIRLGGAWTTVDCSRNPDAYARTILVRLNLNRLRRLGREAQAHMRLAGSRSSELAEDPTAYGTWVGGALQTLPVRQRTALVLVHGWEFSLEEAAELMGCSRNSVKTHLSRGLNRLRGTVRAGGESQ